MAMNIEGIRVRGRIKETIYHKGKIIDHQEAKNLVIKNAGVLLSKLAATGDANSVIEKIGFGTSGSAATPDDVALTDAFVRALVSADVATTPGSVIFKYELGYDQANGKTLRERALLSAAGGMFSRIVRPAIEKTSDIAITGEWIIEFMGA